MTSPLTPLGKFQLNFTGMLPRWLYQYGQNGSAPMNKMAAILKVIFLTSSELKGQLTQNLGGSIEGTCRPKIAKVITIGNPRWPPWFPSWKFVLNFFSGTKRPIDWKLVGNIKVTCKSKIAKTFPIRNPRWPPQPHLENLFWTFSPEPKGQLTQNVIGSNGWLVDKKSLKSFHSCHLENLFQTSFSEPKGKLIGTSLEISRWLVQITALG